MLFINDCYQCIVVGVFGLVFNKKRFIVVLVLKVVQFLVRLLMVVDEFIKYVVRKCVRVVVKLSYFEVINKVVREMKYGMGKGFFLEVIEMYIGVQYKVDVEMLVLLIILLDVKFNVFVVGVKRKVLFVVVLGLFVKMVKLLIVKGKKVIVVDQ